MSVGVYGSGVSMFFIIWDCSGVVNKTTFSVLNAENVFIASNKNVK